MTMGAIPRQVMKTIENNMYCPMCCLIRYLFLIRTIDMDISKESNLIGYTKCQNGRICVLEILSDQDENRNDVVDINFARMQCSNAKVLDIYNMYDASIKYDEAHGAHTNGLKYEVGKIVESDLIYYYLSQEPAYFWRYMPSDNASDISLDTLIIGSSAIYTGMNICFAFKVELKIFYS